jgi:hypothetical protein
MKHRHDRRRPDAGAHQRHRRLARTQDEAAARRARLDQRARPDLFVQVPLATPSGSRLALIRLDHSTKQRARAARTLLYRARPVLAEGQGGRD